MRIAGDHILCLFFGHSWDLERGFIKVYGYHHGYCRRCKGRRPC